ncbi:type B 50S ribosomal protein L31 [[Erwinia] mediterraneensis]|uniref:type B 50S ribosomal protein L31 n=1 Tax=[Erwinia] mediterraneensis TaxID=2161819 RepID=UPI001031F50F|nr:type B 50S ribosomal protein L31 [[Erwinia] mediterraneensis]
MKSTIHPVFRPVVFHDTSVDRYFKIGSTIKTERTIDFQGEILPYVALDISSASHPHYTGRQQAVAREGGAARFRQRYGRLVAGE